jgi:hypothetical protein
MESRELLAGNDLHNRPHGVVARTAKFAARSFIFTGLGKLQHRIVNVAGRSLYRVIRAQDCKRVHRVGAGDSQMNRSSGRQQYAVRDEQILLRDHAHGERTVGVLLSAEIVFDELTCDVQGKWIDSARAAKHLQQRFVNLIPARGRDQKQNQHGQQ